MKHEEGRARRERERRSDEQPLSLQFSSLVPPSHFSPSGAGCSLALCELSAMSLRSVNGIRRLTGLAGLC